MKDVPVDLPDGLHIATVMAREDPRDALVSERVGAITDLAEGARVGTSSLRRQCQLAARRPDLRIVPLRGNVNTRLRKLDEGEFDAILLAAAGLKRLGLGSRIRALLPVEESLPAIGQGAIGIECRTEDAETNTLLAPLHDPDTASCVAAERAMNRRLHGGCQVPIAGHATLRNGYITLRGLVGEPDGSRVLRDEVRGAVAGAVALGEALAGRLLYRGADAILARLYADH
jgi:hydroxymethylbilane synthase